VTGWKRVSGWASLLICAGLIEWSAEGATYRRMSLDALVQGSDYVIYGRVFESRAQWDTATATIWTRTELLVLDGPKGQAGMTMAVTEPGGTINGRGVLYPGTPQFETGQEVVLFLYRAPGNRLRVTGLLQGVYEVITDQQTRERMVQPVVLQPEIAYAGGSLSALTSQRTTAGPENLSRFLYSIRKKAATR
jgi:hypothetical protein